MVEGWDLCVEGRWGGCVLGEDGGRSGKCGYEELIEWKCG